ncbi:hypothetical protein SBV1_1260016 [Verrucomicrobia bacterium]|nr:hypothetical protein SBV1_1260016 [Verrucomicrobiota bacterium]
MTEKEIIKTSKFLSLILRHEPGRVELTLGEAGWVEVDELLRAVNGHGIALTLDQLKQIVATSDKRRFAFSEDGLRIRASQGHSVEIDLQYPPPAERRPTAPGGYVNRWRIHAGSLRQSSTAWMKAVSFSNV